MTTRQFIKEHRFRKTDDGKYMMYGLNNHRQYVLFDGDAQILFINAILPTPQEINTIENLIITYLDDLYLSEFEEIKSMM